MTYDDSVKYFFGVMNDDFYYNITDNIFELSYEEVIKYAKDNNRKSIILDVIGFASLQHWLSG